MKRTSGSTPRRSIGWSIIGGLGFLLAACGSPTVNSATPTALLAGPGTIAPQATKPPSPTAAPTTQDPTPIPSLSVDSTPTSSAVQVSCEAQAPLTPAQTEGPYYTPNTPKRTSLIEPGMTGVRVLAPLGRRLVTGYVLTPDCQPIAHAWLDFWQADDKGQYDNAGYRLRGHQFTDAQGRYTLETIFPGEYPGRTQHIHVKIQAPNGPILTTQIYFPNEPGNARDSIFDPALLADMHDTDTGKVATINFVINAP